jgi:hypothetical protein
MKDKALVDQHLSQPGLLLSAGPAAFIRPKLPPQSLLELAKRDPRVAIIVIKLKPANNLLLMDGPAAGTVLAQPPVQSTVVDVVAEADLPEDVGGVQPPQQVFLVQVDRLQPLQVLQRRGQLLKVPLHYLYSDWLDLLLGLAGGRDNRCYSG